MKQRDVRAFLWDIVQACDVLQQISEERTYEDYATDIRLRWSVERGFEILAEALRNILDAEPELAGRITDPEGIIGFRNRIAHEYWRIMSVMVWGVMGSDVSVLKREVRAILDEMPPPE
ncbi:MAG TPA: HepT-like ribonuclease domain-containing protein [Thermoanaerobaculia bacterium]|nr:HepT-like ribonuclease domain-containing protein [Thermoanaerobaculia bacterium]